MLSIYITIAFWLLVSLYWTIEAKIDSQKSFRFEIVSLLKLVCSALIVYFPLLIGGWFAAVFYPANDWTDAIGIVLCALGIGFAIWGRNALGKNWSGKVMVQKEHSLTKKGPYELVRHPQYAGLLLALVGTSLVLGQIFGFVWTLVLLVGIAAKSKQEEKLLTKEFPSEYPAYERTVKMLIPFIY